MKEKYPIETLLALREQGLSYRQIGAKTGLEYSGVRKRILNYLKRGHEQKVGRPKKRDPKRPYAEVITYMLSPDEIIKRYGKPGEYATKIGTAVTYGYPDLGEKNTRHYSIQERDRRRWAEI